MLIISYSHYVLPILMHLLHAYMILSLVAQIVMSILYGPFHTNRTLSIFDFESCCRRGYVCLECSNELYICTVAGPNVEEHFFSYESNENNIFVHFYTVFNAFFKSHFHFSPICVLLLQQKMIFTRVYYIPVYRETCLVSNYT